MVKKEKTIGKKCKFEQEMLKHIHELKNELREKGWTQRDLPPEVHQLSFLRGDESDAQLVLSLNENQNFGQKEQKFISTYNLKKNLDAIIIYKNNS